MSRKLGNWLIVLVLLITWAAIPVGVVWSLHDLRLNNLQFDPEGWRHGSRRERGKMLDDLMANHLPEGLGEWEVLELLGEPSQREEGRLVYEVDRGTRIFFEPTYFQLTIQLQSDGKLYSVAYHD